jgi:hypothetical protein
MSDDQTRQRARAVIQAGTLPNRPPARTWGGPGLGMPCTICGEAVLPHEVEVEIEFAGDRGGLAARNFHAHVGCFMAWDVERQRVEPGRGAACSGDRAPSSVPISMTVTMAGAMPKAG